jgi:hypothetical protein
MKQLNTNYTAWEKTIHFFGMIWFIIKEIGKLLTKRWFWIALAFILWTYGIAWFNSNYEIKASWKFGVYQRVTSPKKPISMTVQAKEEKKPVIVALTDEQLVKSQKHGDELWTIYMLESTRGKNDGCKQDGQFGGFGVMSLGKPACYDTFQLAVERASYWYEKVRLGNTLDEALCIWNLGIKQPQCRYSQTYHTL